MFEHLNEFLDSLETDRRRLLSDLYATPQGDWSHGHQVAQQRLRWLFRDHSWMYPHRLIMAPGDQNIVLGPDNQIIQRVPNTGNIWFLWGFKNILPDDIDASEFEKDAGHYWDIEYPSIRALYSILIRYQGLRPLLCVQDPSHLSLSAGEIYGTGTPFYNQADYYIKKAYFESWTKDFAFLYASYGPRGTEGGSVDCSEYVGYMAFPVGTLGIQESISLVSETMNENTKHCEWISPLDVKSVILPEEKRIKVGEHIFPPEEADTKASLGQIIGKRVISHSYMPVLDEAAALDEDGNTVDDNTLQQKDRFNIEWPARDYYDQDNPAPMVWARYYFPADGRFPMPGELVCMICKTLEFTVWWFQRTNPFIYAGNWYETEFYTSGIVEEVIAPDEERDKNELVPVLKVLCKGRTVYIKPSDFADYQKGMRVAILKYTSDCDSFYRPLTGTFFSEEMNMDEASDSDDLTPHQKAREGWWAVPITFYNNDDKDQIFEPIPSF